MKIPNLGLAAALLLLTGCAMDLMMTKTDARQAPPAGNSAGEPSRRAPTIPDSGALPAGFTTP